MPDVPADTAAQAQTATIHDALCEYLKAASEPFRWSLTLVDAQRAVRAQAALDALVAELDRQHESWLKMRDRYVAEYNAHGEARAEFERVTREHAEENASAWSLASELAAAAGREQRMREAANDLASAVDAVCQSDVAGGEPTLESHARSVLELALQRARAVLEEGQPPKKLLTGKHPRRDNGDDTVALHD